MILTPAIYVIVYIAFILWTKQLVRECLRHCSNYAPREPEPRASARTGGAARAQPHPGDRAVVATAADGAHAHSALIGYKGSRGSLRRPVRSGHRRGTSLATQLRARSTSRYLCGSASSRRRAFSLRRGYRRA